MMVEVFSNITHTSSFIAEKSSSLYFRLFCNKRACVNVCAKRLFMCSCSNRWHGIGREEEQMWGPQLSRTTETFFFGQPCEFPSLSSRACKKQRTQSNAQFGWFLQISDSPLLKLANLHL